MISNFKAFHGIVPERGYRVRHPSSAGQRAMKRHSKKLFTPHTIPKMTNLKYLQSQLEDILQIEARSGPDYIALHPHKEACIKRINELMVDKAKESELKRAKLAANKEIISKLKETERAKAEIYKALAAKNAKEVRAGARTLRSNGDNGACPYCGNELGDKPHLDHIYPVSKGGRSTKGNTVMVCAKCNQRKRDKTLSQFIMDECLNRQEIENRLIVLKKEF